MSCTVGQSVFEENGPSNDMYVIARGEVEIQVDPGLVGQVPPGTALAPATIATLRPGQIFGEIALVDQGLRSATARVTAPDTQLVVIPREQLMALCDTYPQLGYRLMRNLAADLALKIRSTDLEIRAQLLWKPNVR